MRREPQAGPRLPTALAWLAALVLMGTRLLHLRGPLDDPASWRQCDTVAYSLDLFRRGFDVLHPRVAWLGPHRTLILEFPLPEALAALLYRLGGPHALWDRVVALGFYAVATVYLFRLARRAAGRAVAGYATLVWLALPLGQFYSRAAQVDVATTAFAHAFLWHALEALRRRSPGQALLAGAAATLAALIKAPYLLPVLPVLGLAALAAPAGIPWLALAGAGSALLFALWRRHVNAVNAATPDWSFLPGWYREVDPWWWYFGTASQRADLGNWARIARRLLHEVATLPGLLVMLAGALLPAGARPAEAAGAVPARPGGRGFALAWALGVAVYVAVFFNLNVIHDYYLIPALAPAALLAGLGLEALGRRTRPLVAWVALAIVVIASFLAPRGLGYYQVDWLRVEAGRAIAAHTASAELVVACDRQSGWSDPRLLVRADRDGWSLAIPDLTPGRLARLAALGARTVAIVSLPGDARTAPPGFLAPALALEVPVAHDGRPLGTLRLYRLEPPR